mmetsp:Transcript_57637/g.153515  ORF Transcript_57637/g.153515 Transcript_57637/m.153515 type:complete len:245 (+) Transcript_57637:2059-2793(+)
MPRRTRRTISAFCNGETRHAMTTSHVTATLCKNCCFRSSSSIITPIAAPVTSIPRFLSGLLQVSIASSNVTPAAPRSTMNMSIVSSRTLELKPMSRAVSRRSPVNTHSFIPAPLMFTMVWGTSTCNLSSMAVAPTISKSCSISSAAEANAPSRSCRAFSAALNFASQPNASSFVRFRLARQSVLKPSFANFVRCSIMTSSPTFDLSRITLSAPLIIKMYSPSRSTTTDILFLVELKALLAKIVY